MLDSFGKVPLAQPTHLLDNVIARRHFRAYVEGVGIKLEVHRGRWVDDDVENEKKSVSRHPTYGSEWRRGRWRRRRRRRRRRAQRPSHSSSLTVSCQPVWRGHTRRVTCRDRGAEARRDTGAMARRLPRTETDGSDRRGKDASIVFSSEKPGICWRLPTAPLPSLGTLRATAVSFISSNSSINFASFAVNLCCVEDRTHSRKRGGTQTTDVTHAPQASDFNLLITA